MSYIITQQRHFYAGTLGADALERLSVPIYFRTYAAALAHLSELKSLPYHPAHGEYSLPTYHVRRADSRRGRAALDRLGW